MRVFLAMLVFAMSACVTACVSSQTLETPVISEQAKDKLLPKDKLLRIESLNRSHAPYRDYSITMNIRSPAFENELSKLTSVMEQIDPSQVFEVTIEENGYKLDHKIPNIEIESIAESLDTAVTKGKEDIHMLLKYLQGFYYEDLLNPEMDHTVLSNDSDVFKWNYEYRNIKSVNLYKFRNSVLNSIEIRNEKTKQVFVEIYLDFVEKNGLHYLIGFSSKNLLHGFKFSYSISYKELRGLFLPSKITTTVGGALFGTEFVYHILNHQISAKTGQLSLD